jgi:hypothetical protein
LIAGTDIPVIRPNQRETAMQPMLCLVCGAALWGADVTLLPSTTTPAVNATFTVTVQLTHATPFASWGDLLTFDSAALELTAQSAGTFATFVPDSRSLAVINGSGEVRAGGFSLSDNAGGDGSLSVFTFKVLQAGSTTIASPNKTARNDFGNVLITKDGVETIPNTATSITLNVAGPPPSLPEITWKRGTADIADGATDTVTGTNAGSATALSYTIGNSGTSALGITAPATSGTGTNCAWTITAQPTSSVAAGGTTSLTLSVTPTAAGPWSLALAVTNTDADENPYDVTVSGTAGMAPTTAPAAPTGLAATPDGPTAITLAWTDASDNESGFRIERRTDTGAFAPVTTAAADATGIADTGLTASTTYVYRVLAYNSVGDSAWTAEVRATTTAQPKTGGGSSGGGGGDGGCGAGGLAALLAGLGLALGLRRRHC